MGLACPSTAMLFQFHVIMENLQRLTEKIPTPKKKAIGHPTQKAWVSGETHTSQSKTPLKFQQQFSGAFAVSFRGCISLLGYLGFTALCRISRKNSFAINEWDLKLSNTAETTERSLETPKHHTFFWPSTILWDSYRKGAGSDRYTWHTKISYIAVRKTNKPCL